MPGPGGLLQGEGVPSLGMCAWSGGSAGGGVGCLVWGCAWSGGVPGLGGSAVGVGCLVQGEVCLVQRICSGGLLPGVVSQHALRQTPLGETATAVDSTHPTGMHSCL